MKNHIFYVLIWLFSTPKTRRRANSYAKYVIAVYGNDAEFTLASKLADKAGRRSYKVIRLAMLQVKDLQCSANMTAYSKIHPVGGW